MVKYADPFDDIFQLPDIARPGIGEQLLAGGRRKVLELFIETFAEDAEKIVRQDQGILTPLAQWGGFNTQHIQAVIEIFPELLLLNRQLQILVGGGDDSQIDGDITGAAQPAERLMLQHPQQLGLQRRAHLADLIQEERALVGFFQQAFLGGLGIGEGAFLIAKQFTL